MKSSPLKLATTASLLDLTRVLSLYRELGDRAGRSSTQQHRKDEVHIET
jgi:hypothetical protein